MYKVGFGKDIHVFKKGYPLILCGVKIPYKKGLVSHADGDCVIHAIVDSILGSLGMDDIGTLFPDTSKEYEGISSTYFLDECKKFIEERNKKISNIDVFISLEEPKLKPYIKEMKEVVSSHLGVDINSISIKCGTNEKQGYIGKKKACEAYAVCLMEDKDGR